MVIFDSYVKLPEGIRHMRGLNSKRNAQHMAAPWLRPPGQTEEIGLTAAATWSNKPQTAVEFGGLPFEYHMLTIWGVRP